MKRVLITLYRNKCHSLYKQFINNPPEGYQYLTLDDVTDEYIFTPARTFFGELVNKYLRNQKIVQVARKHEVDIIYCCDGILLFNSPIPWVVDLEHVTGFIAHYFAIWKYAKWILPGLLAQKNLKYIIPWTEAGAKSIERNLKLSSQTRKKIVPIHLCLDRNPGIISKKTRSSGTTLLFVTSVNYNSDGEFYQKGGRIVIAIYEKLRKKDLDVKLFLRSRLPVEYERFRADKNVRIYEDVLEAQAFDRLFSEADIFLFPGYQSPGMAFLDAMYHGLPILTTNVFANSEMVRDGSNGFIVKFCEKNNVYHLRDKFGINSIPVGKFSKTDHICENMIEEFSEKITWLISNPEELRLFGIKSTELLRKEYSLELRNKRLGFIFDKAIT